MKKKVRYFTKEELFEAASIAVLRDYNRQIDPSWVADHIDDDTLIPVVFDMIHEHRAGEPVAPHIRVVIVVNENGDQRILDVDWELFHKLSAKEVSESADAR